MAVSGLLVNFIMEDPEKQDLMQGSKQDLKQRLHDASGRTVDGRGRVMQRGRRQFYQPLGAQ
jgi:hypothetical protein